MELALDIGMKPNIFRKPFSALHASLVVMSTDSLAGKRSRILTDVDEATIRVEVKRRLDEIDRSEVELRSADEVWREVFGHAISSPPRPR